MRGLTGSKAPPSSHAHSNQTMQVQLPHLQRAVGLVLAVVGAVAPRDAGAGLGLSGSTQVVCAKGVGVGVEELKVVRWQGTR